MSIFDENPFGRKTTAPVATGLGLGLSEDQLDYENMRIREEYQMAQSRNLNARDFMPPTKLDPGHDIVEIMFGDSLASLGFSVDKKKLDWDLETAKDFWTEHPIRSLLATATTLVPTANVLTKPFRGAKAAGVGAETVAQMGLVDNVADFHALGRAEQKILQNQAYALTQNRALEEAVEAGVGSVKDQALYKFNKAFGNSYMEQTDPKLLVSARTQWIDGMRDVFKDTEPTAEFLKRLPDDEGLGIKIARYFNDPGRIHDIPKKHRAIAMRMADELRTTQLTAVKEGMISPEEAAHVGEVWFSTVRKGTQRDFGQVTTVLDKTKSGTTRVLTVPKTQSPNLLQREASAANIEEHLTKLDAAHALSTGSPETAIRLLKEKPGYQDAIDLINSGDHGAARRLLTAGGEIDFRPSAITHGSVVHQKALLEAFRTVRDIALNKDITKSAAELQGVLKSGQYLNLDDLDNADRIRRMVGTKLGTDVSELGWVPKKLFGEVKELTGQGESFRSGYADFMNVVTAMYKTAKTAFNLPTHGQNMIGNSFFLVNRGVNPFSRDFLGLQKLSWHAITSMQRAARKGGSIGDELTNLGESSKLKGLNGKTIDVVEEINSPELKDLIEESSLIQEEGIGPITNAIKNAQDGPTKYLAQLYNKAMSKTKAEKFADWYMAEDGMAKMAYFLHLRQRGLNRSAALFEVGRSLPMYTTVGDVPRFLRGHLLPWVTFPAEAARIMKNNLNDHPLKTLAMLQIPQMLQLGAYQAGATGLLGAEKISGQDLDAIKAQAPTWAQKPSSIVTPWTDDNEDLRVATLDYLPYSSVMPATTAKEAPFLKQLPFGADNPFPILGGIMYAMTGKDPWGREYPTEGALGKAKVAAMNTVGLIMPPLLQRYLLNPRDPKMGYSFLQDAGKAVNPYTNKKGDPFFDLFMNRVAGARSYAANPEQQIANQNFMNQNFSKLRGRYAREWSALLKSGDLNGASGKLRDIHMTLVNEHGDPAVANAKFVDWLDKHRKDIANHPQLRGMSETDIRQKLKDLLAAGPIRSRAAGDLYNAYSRELGVRGRQSDNGSKNPLFGGSVF